MFAAIAQSRHFLDELRRTVGAVHGAHGTLKDAFTAAHDALAPEFGGWPIFEHCLPFNVQRYWDELDGIDWPRIWTAARDQEVWAALRTIPYGQTWTYGQLAAAVGNPGAARAVGLANGRNPISIVVPCHRVVGSDGSMTGYAGGVGRKEFLLSLERGGTLV